jgi:hypothetical protein
MFMNEIDTASRLSAIELRLSTIKCRILPLMEISESRETLRQSRVTIFGRLRRVRFSELDKRIHRGSFALSFVFKHKARQFLVVCSSVFAYLRLVKVLTSNGEGIRSLMNFVNDTVPGNSMRSQLWTLLKAKLTHQSIINLKICDK